MPEEIWTLPALKEHFEALLRERDKALDVKSAELARRLDDLNHAHQRAVEVQHTYVTEEKFNSFVERFEENKATTAEALTLARGSEQGTERVAVHTERRREAKDRSVHLLIAAGVALLAVVTVVTNLLTAH
jgi:hypothetical protein